MSQLMSQQRIDAARALIAEGKVADDYAGLTDQQALDVIMLRVRSEPRARFILALARGEITGDVIREDEDEDDEDVV